MNVIIPSDTLTLQLNYYPPYNWKSMIAFLAAHMIKDVEFITEEFYSRTVRLGKHTGWIKVTHAPKKYALIVNFTYSLAPVLPALLDCLRNLFDLSAQPEVIATHLIKDECLKEAVIRNPGLRVPGAFDGFEMAVRAILGQQITVRAATTIACRFADAFGDKIRTPFAELTRLSPLPKHIVKTTVDEIARLGIISNRAKSILALAKAFMIGEIQLKASSSPEEVINKLIALPGIGPWTAHHIAMRALRWSDAFLKEDIVIRNNLGGITAKKAEDLSQTWRPWRSYAVMHIWENPELINLREDKKIS